MRKPLEKPEIFLQRREKLKNLIPGGSVLVVFASPESYRNGSVMHNYRADSNMYYLTGFEEPESIFVFRPGLKPESILFTRKKDASREIWDGFRFGPEAAKAEYKVDQTFPVEEFESKMIDLLKGSERIYYRQYKNPAADLQIKKVLQEFKFSQGRSGLGILPIYDADELIGELRLFKTDNDIKNHRHACEISAEAHIELMKYVRPGMSERELHGYFIYQVMKKGAAREGYGGIFASGPDACILHYVFNDKTVKAGDLFLVDAAGEFQYFTSDITRTYPVNGRYTKPQSEVYSAVLRTQKSIVEMIRPGLPFAELQKASIELLTHEMLELGLLTGRKEDLIETKEFRKYYPHGVSHFLGMDVHDSGIYQSRKDEPRNIEAGMVFTVEPGLYIPAHDSSDYAGIGVRIEDDILVTKTGSDILTVKCPKEIPEVEALIGR